MRASTILLLLTRSLRYHVVRALLLFLFFLGALILFGETHFYRDPLRIFYDDKRAFVRWYSEIREAQASSYIAEFNRSDFGEYAKSGGRPAVCAVFTTVKRERVQYLPVRSGLEPFVHKTRINVPIRLQ